MWINSETASLTREQNWEKRLENVKQKRDQVSNRCLARIVISATELFLEGGTIVWSWTIIPKCISSLVSRSRTKTLWVRLLWQQVELLSCELRQLQTCESSFSCLGTQVTILSDCCVTALWHWAGWKLKNNTAPIEAEQPEELSKVNLHQQKTRVWRISWLVLLVSGMCSGSRVVAGAAPGETRARPWSRTTPPVHSTHPRVDCHAAVMIRGTSAYHWRRLEVAGWVAPARTHAKLFVLATTQYNAYRLSILHFQSHHKTDGSFKESLAECERGFTKGVITTKLVERVNQKIIHICPYFEKASFQSTRIIFGDVIKLLSMLTDFCNLKNMFEVEVAQVAQVAQAQTRNHSWSHRVVWSLRRIYYIRYILPTFGE